MEPKPGVCLAVAAVIGYGRYFRHPRGISRFMVRSFLNRQGGCLLRACNPRVAAASQCGVERRPKVRWQTQEQATGANEWLRALHLSGSLLHALGLGA